MSKEVNAMFSSIARRYDLANDVLSMGMHRLWRQPLLAWGGVSRGSRVLDLCSGTGDVTFAAASRVGRDGAVYGVDFVPEMVRLAAAKAPARRSGDRAPVEFLLGDALRIPFADGTFDAVTIAFGIRNVDDPVSCLKEIGRVLAPDGRALILEFGQPYVPIFREAYGFYSRHVMPFVGGALTGNRSAYEYLPRTSGEFPAGKEFLPIIAAGGLEDARFRPLLGGVAYMYSGTAPARAPLRKAA